MTRRTAEADRERPTRDDGWDADEMAEVEITTATRGRSPDGDTASER